MSGSLVTAEQAGTYRQHAHRLRWNLGARERVSERPRHDKTRSYLDSDAEPTLVTFAEGDAVDIPSLLEAGAISTVPTVRAPTTTVEVGTAPDGGKHGKAGR